MDRIALTSSQRPRTEVNLALNVSKMPTFTRSSLEVGNFHDRGSTWGQKWSSLDQCIQYTLISMTYSFWTSQEMKEKENFDKENTNYVDDGEMVDILAEF